MDDPTRGTILTDCAPRGATADAKKGTYHKVVPRIILDLCAGSGEWSRPYREAGYDVRLVTLPANDVRVFIPPLNVHGILAAPPCTMFSLARTRAKKPRNFREGMEIVYACLRIVWECRASGNLAWWALENPRGFLRQFLGLPVITWRPCDFGDLWTKPTDLWGYFREPRKSPIKIVKPKGRVSGGTRDWSFAKTGKNGLSRQEVRSITPPGFAKAFFEANP